MMNNDQGDIDVMMQEEVTKQRMLAQKKEKKIKIIRILTVIAYLVSVSTVATMLSAYYIFIWNPHAANYTQTPNAERMVMALQRASGEYNMFANSAEFADNRRLAPQVPDDYKTDDQSSNPERSVKLQTSSSIKTWASHVQTKIGNISEPFTVADNLS